MKFVQNNKILEDSNAETLRSAQSSMPRKKNAPKNGGMAA